MRIYGDEHISGGCLMTDSRLLPAPEPFTTIRWRCPYCPRTYSNKYRAQRHIARCWHNPAARSCKTCAHYQPGYSEPEVGWVEPESCEAGVDLTTAAEDNQGRPTLPVDCPLWAALTDQKVTR